MSNMAALPPLFNKCRTQAYPNPDAPPVTTATQSDGGISLIPSLSAFTGRPSMKNLRLCGMRGWPCEIAVEIEILFKTVSQFPSQVRMRYIDQGFCPLSP